MVFLEHKEELIGVINSLKKIINDYIKNKIEIKRDSLIEIISVFTKIGMQYGHSIKLKKCDSRYLLDRKDEGMSIIDINKSIKAIIEGISLVKSMVKDKANIFIISKNFFSKFNSLNELPNVQILSKWIPGYLCNDRVRTRCKKLNKSSIIPDLIVNLNINVFEIISKEINIINSRKTKKIILISIIDTEIKTNDVLDSTIIPIVLNNESLYYNIIISELINHILLV